MLIIFIKRFKNKVKRFITNKSKYINDNSTQNKSGITILALIVIIILATVFLIVSFSVKNNVKKSNMSKDIVDFNNISEPYQKKTDKSIKINRDGMDIDMELVYEYVIQGKVVSIADYSNFLVSSTIKRFENTMSQKDFGIVWGELATSKYDDVVKFYRTQDRFLNFSVSDVRIISLSQVTRQFSNNHLIYANDDVKVKCETIREGDYISLTGYLVNLYYEDETHRKYYWNSSTSRTDTQDGACEIIYVTDVKLLQNSNDSQK